MKVNKIIFTILAGASLGFALPSHSANKTLGSSPTEIPSVGKTPGNSSDIPSVGKTPGNSSDIPSVGKSSINPLAASLPPGISKDCAAAILTIVISPEFLKCVPIIALLPLTPILTDPAIITKFIADPAHNYPPLEQPLLQSAKALCPAPKCSDAGVAGAIKTIQDGCKADLANPLIQMGLALATFYSPIRDSFCFQDKKHFCWDETVLTVIKLPQSPIKVVGNPLLDSVAVADPPVICTDCNKSIYNTFANFLTKKKDDPLVKQILASLKIDDKVLNQIVLFFAVKCGISFEDGKIPIKS